MLGLARSLSQRSPSRPTPLRSSSAMKSARGSIIAALTFGMSLLLGVTLLPSTARGHGGPASVEVVSHHRAAPGRLAVSTSYGLASSHDDGGSWSLTCEGAIGETGATHPRVVVNANGELLAGLFSGPVMSDAAGCSYAAVQPMAGYITLDLQNVPGDAHGLIALTRQNGSYQIWRSADDGATWERTDPDFGPKFRAFSVGASSDPNRIYVGGRSDTDGFAMMMVTDDGGQTFVGSGVPGVIDAPEDALFVETVDPSDPMWVVAASYEPPSRVWLSSDGGGSWRELFEGWTVLTGLAVSPDHDAIVTGSPAMGLWRVGIDDAGIPEEPEQVSEVPVRCLTWTETGLLVCTDEGVTGYAVGRSHDAGVTMTPLLELTCMTRPTCESNDPVTQLCASEWPSLVDAVGIVDCDGTGGADPGAGGAASEGGQSAEGGTGGTAGHAVRYRPVGGCEGCTAGGGSWDNVVPYALSLGWLIWPLRSRRRRRR